MSSSKKFKSATKYKVDKESQKIKLPLLTGTLLFIISLKYLGAAFYALGKGESFYFLTSILIFSMILTSFLLLRKGVSLELKYNKSKYAKSSKLPYKTLGAAFLASATFISAYLGSYGFIASLMLGLSVLAGWYMYYGFDPREDKIAGYESDKSAQRIMALLVKANEDIASIKEYAKELNSQTIAPLMQEMAEEFERIVKHIEDEPDDYDKARKYLVSYLGELKDMSKTFMKLDAKAKTKEIEDDFMQTLRSSIQKLQQQYEKLMDDDILDLDIKLSVMKKRFKNEE